MSGGAFLTSREIFGHPVWKNIVEFRLFFLIYGNAVFSEEGVKVNETLTLQRGQWLRSTRKLQEDLEYIENRQVKRYSTSTINRAIKSLSHVKVQMLCTRSHELGTVFTVVNYEQYQGFGGYKKMELGTELGTVTKQSQNNNNNVYKGYKRKDLINIIFSHWTNLDLIKHRKLTPQIERQIDWKLGDYEPDEIIQCIDIYNEILNSTEYILDTRWSLHDFLEKGHFEKFLPERDPRSFYRRSGRLAAPKDTKLDSNLDFLRSQIGSDGGEPRPGRIGAGEGERGLPE